MNNFLKNLGRGLLGALYVVTPILGWIGLSRSIKRVNPGEISLISNVGGDYEILQEGIYFRPFPGDRFGPNYKKDEDYIDMGPVKRIRIKEGERGVVNDNGTYKELSPGIHFIDNTRNQTFNKATDIQKINQLDYTLGATRYVTILNGELGESYRDGQFIELAPGKHALPPNHIFKKKVSVASDIIDLGALKIITVKQGQVAIINGPEGNIIKGAGKHYVKQEEGCFFDRLITVSPQVLTLVPLTVMCTDKIEMKADAVLLYKIEDPLKTVGSGVDRVLRDLKEYAEGTLRSILRKFSSSDIALTLHPDENHSSHNREKKLQEIHDDFVNKLDTRASGWGIKINDLQFTQILPADERYHNNLRDIGSRQSTADANKTLAETEAAIANIKAQAEVSKVTAAKIEQQEAMVRADTESQKMKIQADAEYNQTLQRARGQADGIKVVADAESERLTKLGKVADGFKSELAGSLALLDRQGKILESVKNPVLIQPQLGQTRVWSDKDNNRTTFFTTHPRNENMGSNSVQEYLALETSNRIKEMPKRA